MVRISWLEMSDAEKAATEAIGDGIRAALKDLPILSACRVLARFEEWDMDEFVSTWVHEARSEGHSWQEIGDALGVSRQAVWERWAKIEAEVAVEELEQRMEDAAYEDD